MNTYTHETHVSPQRPNETDEGYSRRIADTLHNAAPDLLAALRVCLTWAEIYDRQTGPKSISGPLFASIQQARAAIAKAEGRA